MVTEHLDSLLDKERAATAKPTVTDPDILAALTEIGITEPDYTDPLHRKLVDALVRTRGAVWGDRLVALKFVFNWAQFQAGKEFADAQADWLHQIDVRTVPLVAPADGSKGLTRAFAEQTVRAQEDMYELQLKALVAEKREQSLRKMLDTLQSALDNHRTSRADWRAADVEHGRTGT
jgi:hypothetical protein